MNRPSAAGLQPRDLTPLADRLGLLQLVRAVIVAGVMGATAFAPDVVHMRATEAARPTAVYALVTVLAELCRRAAHRRGLRAVQLVVLADGVYLTALVAPIGGTASALMFVLYLHVVAVTLLMSPRAGLKVALWDSLLMVAGYSLATTGHAARLFGMTVEVAPHRAASTLGGIAFLAVAAGTAAFSSLSERELRRGKAELGALAAMTGEMENARAADEIGRILVDRVCSIFGFEAGTIVAVAPHQAWPDGARDAVVDRCRQLRAPHLVSRLDPAGDAVLAGLLPEARNVVVVPLVTEGHVLAVAAFVRGGHAGIRMQRTTIASISSFVGHAALALRNAWLLEEVERLARTDPLTGLANRRTFEAGLQREVARATRSGEPLSLVVLDVDHFKHINDTAGHQAGDDVLRFIGQVLAGHAREMDLPARYGGEEFCVVLPGCPPSEAVAVAERLRASVAEYTGHPGLTASAGVATIPDHAAQAEALLAAADEALYESKRAGRNRTTMSTRTGKSIRLLA